MPKGLTELREGLRLWRETGSRLFVPYRLGIVADALAAAGRREEALGLLDEASEATELIGERWFEAKAKCFAACPATGETSQRSVFGKH